MAIRRTPGPLPLALALALVLAAILGTSALHAQGALRPAPSGRATTEVVLLPVDSAARAAAEPARIRIDYGQPHLRGRRLHTDSLVPYDRVWRTGANEATTLTTDVDLVIGGARVPRGRYVLQTVPGRDGGKLLVQTEAQAGEAQPGATTTQPGAPVAPREVARIDLRRSTLATPLESLTFWLIPSTQPGAARGELRLAWGTTAFSTDWSVP
mgnify:CR=1 FL=1